jgi:DNA polymerase-4
MGAMDRCILHCDMNNFYASVECMLDMSLRGHPVAVGGDVENRHGIILAKNYEAKKYGVSTGEALWQARQKCRNLIIVPPHYEQYLKYSKLAREIYADYTDQIEPYGMDECWLDITGSVPLMGSGEEIANEIRERMKFELGLSISVGVSFNKIFAKLGSDMKKPDATTVIPKETFREKIWSLPASDMLGVGRATEKVLTSYGIHTIGELAKTPPELLQSRFGKCGLQILRYANGGDCSPVAKQDYEPPIKSIGHGITTKEDLENAAEVWNVMLSLTQDIGHKLRVYNKDAGGIAIDIRDNQLEHRQWQCQFPARTHSTSYIAKSAFDLFMRSYPWSNPIRSVTVRVINLSSQDLPEQLDLFIDRTQIERHEKLESVVEQLRDRFGKYAVIPAALCSQNSKMPTDREIELKMPTGMVS